MIYEWGPETSTKLIVGNAKLGQRYVQDILSLAPGPMESLGGPYDRFLWFSMVLLGSAWQPQSHTREIGSTLLSQTQTTWVSAANSLHCDIYSGLKASTSFHIVESHTEHYGQLKTLNRSSWPVKHIGQRSLFWIDRLLSDVHSLWRLVRLQPSGRVVWTGHTRKYYRNEAWIIADAAA